MTERTHSSLSVKVKSAKETERQLDDTFAERKHELDAAQKHKEALCLNCDTVDQALENVLRETKSEYQNLTKRNELCSSLSLVNCAKCQFILLISVSHGLMAINVQGA